MDAEVEDYYKFYSLECGLNQRRYYNPGDKSILVSDSKNGYYPSGHHFLVKKGTKTVSLHRAGPPVLMAKAEFVPFCKRAPK